MNVRGGRVMSRRATELHDGGLTPVRVVYAITPNSQERRHFIFHCRKNGMDAKLVHQDCHSSPGVDAYEVVGGIRDLQLLKTDSRVVGIHYVMDVRTPRVIENDEPTDVRRPDPFARCPKNVSVRVKREFAVRRLPVSAQTELDRREYWGKAEKDTEEFRQECERMGR